MTPLAQRFFRQLTLPVRQRQVSDEGGVLDKLDDLHCFEMSAVSAAVNRAIENEKEHVVEACAHLVRKLFLPSPRTWLEYRHDSEDSPGCRGSRTAVLIERSSDKEPAKYLLSLVIDDPLCSIPIGAFWSPSAIDAGKTWAGQATIVTGYNGSMSPEQRRSVLNRFVCETLLFVDMINTPGLIGLKSHDPHRGLARDLRRSGAGRYPLRAWSEVVIHPDTIEAGDAEHETGLTGRKCLHFVRAHRRRFYDGSETVVTHHWRGDAALGIKRTRYRVAPPLNPPIISGNPAKA